MVKAVVLLSVVSALGAVTGCDESPFRPSVDSFCDGVCRGVDRCGGQFYGCYDACRKDPLNGGLAGVRPDVAAAVADCVAQLDCQTIFDGPYDTCWEHARGETPPSAHLRSFCPSYSTSLFECGYWFPVDDCEDRLKIWTDQFLDDLAACTRAPTCEETDACLEARFGS